MPVLSGLTGSQQTPTTTAHPSILSVSFSSSLLPLPPLPHSILKDRGEGRDIPPPLPYFYRHLPFPRGGRLVSRDMGGGPLMAQFGVGGSPFFFLLLFAAQRGGRWTTSAVLKNYCSTPAPVRPSVRPSDRTPILWTHSAPRKKRGKGKDFLRYLLHRAVPSTIFFLFSLFLELPPCVCTQATQGKKSSGSLPLCCTCFVVAPRSPFSPPPPPSPL